MCVVHLLNMHSISLKQNSDTDGKWVNCRYNFLVSSIQHLNALNMFIASATYVVIYHPQYLKNL